LSFIIKKMNFSQFEPNKAKAYFSDDEITKESSSKLKARFLDSHLEKYPETPPKLFESFKNFFSFLPKNSNINNHILPRSITLENIINKIEADNANKFSNLDHNTKEKHPLRIKSASFGENLDKLEDFHCFYSAIKQQKRKVFYFFYL